MLTRVQVDGFKNLADVDLAIRPFQAIAGRNGAGKSNLFDALSLLGALAENDIATAFASMRGEPYELFSQNSDGTPGARIRLCVELLADSTIRDQWGKSEQLAATRLRYEIIVVRRRDDSGADDLRIEKETLEPIQKASDVGLYSDLVPFAKYAARREAFISTDIDAHKIALHQDGRAGRKQEFHPEQMRGSVLSGITSTAFRHAFAVRQELCRWVFLQLSPHELRSPSPFLSPSSISNDGRHAASTLARIVRDDERAPSRLANQLARLVPRVKSVRVDKDDARQVFTTMVTFTDGREFSSRVLSDGTLRLMALLTLAIDPLHRTVVCLEEPENGVHPASLRYIVKLLRQLAFDQQSVATSGLRQIIFNTHSPSLINLLDHESIVFCVLVDHVDPATKTTVQRSHFLPVRDTGLQLELSPEKTKSIVGITRNELRQFLSEGGIQDVIRASVETDAGGTLV